LKNRFTILGGQSSAIRKISTMILLFGLILISFIWIGLLFKLQSEQEHELNHYTRETANLARAFEEHTLRTIRNADQIALFLKYQYEQQRRTIDISPYLKVGIFSSQLFVLLSIANEEGDLVFSNQEPFVPSNIKDREHFQVHQAIDSGRLFISKPLFGRSSGKWSVQMTRRINKPDGSFGGVVVVSLNPVYFAEFYKQVDLGKNSSIALIGRDGTTRAWQSGQNYMIRPDLQPNSDKLMEQLAVNEAGHYIDEIDFDGIKRIYSYRALQEYPLVVNVGIAESEALADFYQRRNNYYQIAFLLSLFITGVCSMLFHMTLACQRSEATSRYLGTHDILTGLYNRAFFEKELERFANSNIPVTVVICDIDGLKLVNDTFGHAAGDQLLLVTTQIIQCAIRSGDTFARIGGDEFALILPAADDNMVHSLCEEIRSQIMQHNQKSSTIPISISLGYAVRHNKTIAMQELLKEADQRMYREKLHHSQSARSNLVQTVMKLLEERDVHTENHSERLQNFVSKLARYLQLSETRIADLKLLAKFHDIGKVGIPDHILLKQEPLTDDEKKEMQRHCEIGYRIARASIDLLPIADWILKHHEWWNGNGYPLGLAGNEIPIECRILAITDAYDAMTSDRPYRKAISRETAIAELKQCAGTQFDPDLVYAFIAII